MDNTKLPFEVEEFKTLKERENKTKSELPVSNITLLNVDPPTFN
jgi:hypothetical protein